MTILRGLIMAVLALPLLEIVAFVLVAVAIGFGPALALLVALSVAGALVIRHGGTAHISRVRLAVGENNLAALQADGTGTLILIGGVLLALPGFITGALGLLLLAFVALRHLTGPRRTTETADDGVVDLAPEDWRQVPDQQISDRRDRDGRR